MGSVDTDQTAPESFICVSTAAYILRDILVKKFWKHLFLLIWMCIINLHNSFPDDKILDWSKLKQIAEDILKSI